MGRVRAASCSLCQARCRKSHNNLLCINPEGRLGSRGGAYWRHGTLQLSAGHGGSGGGGHTLLTVLPHTLHASRDNML